MSAYPQFMATVFDALSRLDDKPTLKQERGIEVGRFCGREVISAVRTNPNEDLLLAAAFLLMSNSSRVDAKAHAGDLARGFFRELADSLREAR